MTGRNAVALGALLGLVWAGWPTDADARSRHRPAAHAQAHGRHHAAEPHRERAAATVRPGRAQRGKASVYASSLRGRRMADGTPFNPASNAAASKTLPLGTTARVTNVENGRTTVVQVRDRGPHRAGRIIDVSPGTADALGMTRDGVAPVRYYVAATTTGTYHRLCPGGKMAAWNTNTSCRPWSANAPNWPGKRTPSGSG